MPNLTTYGFEFEVQTEAPALVRHLFDEGHVPYGSMHRWHCECDECDVEAQDQYLFYAQTDSSCSGEVITRILHHDPASPYYRGDVFQILQDAAVETDAEPGLAAGMHVHVGVGHLTELDKAKSVWAFLKMEPVLTHIAGGRWGYARGNNNTLMDLHAYLLRDRASNLSGYTRDDGSYTRLIPFLEASGTGKSEMYRSLYRSHLSADRHSNLNVNTGHGTHEFRLWNSTRSAWRMELFTRLSVAMVDKVVVKELLALPYPHQTTRTAMESFSDLLNHCEHHRAADLLDRQTVYLFESAETAPTTLTAS